MTPSEAPATTKYALNTAVPAEMTATLGTALRRLAPLMADEKRTVTFAFSAILVTTATTLVGPIVIGRAVDVYMRRGDFSGVVRLAGVLLGVYVIGLFASYFQTQQMGLVGRKILFNLRNTLFAKLQDLPLHFFNQNKSGDLISRINNDTDKLNLFFAQSLVQLTSNVFGMTGAAILLLSLNWRLGALALVPAFVVLAITRVTATWVKRRNLAGLQTLGGMSAEIQESLANFRVIVAFNRLDYFREKFEEANRKNFAASVRSGLASNLFVPLYGLSFNLAQLVALVVGVTFIANGQLTVGVLISTILYVNNFYFPLRQLAVVWASLQLALAALDRISAVLALESDMPQKPALPAPAAGPVIAFEDVDFSYPGGAPVLTGARFALMPGRTYALVGPTGGGKTTTASLMARLYDPTNGRVRLDGRDIREYTPAERAQKVGFILQDPFLFTGTVRDNIVYGHPTFRQYSNDQITSLLAARGLDSLLTRFPNGLDTPVISAGDAISLGQKQIVAFIRAILRDPEILILDEATANVDTVTERVLDDILSKLPAKTTKVIIAHRLNTIAGADEIFFINAAEITPAGSMEHAIEMLRHGVRSS